MVDVVPKTADTLTAFANPSNTGTVIDRSADLGLIYDVTVPDMKKIAIGFLLDWRGTVGIGVNTSLSRATHHSMVVYPTANGLTATLWSPLAGDRVLIRKPVAYSMKVAPIGGGVLHNGGVNKTISLLSYGHLVFQSLIDGEWEIEREACEWNFDL